MKKWLYIETRENAPLRAVIHTTDMKITPSPQIDELMDMELTKEFFTSESTQNRIESYKYRINNIPNFNVKLGKLNLILSMCTLIERQMMVACRDFKGLTVEEGIELAGVLIDYLVEAPEEETGPFYYIFNKEYLKQGNLYQEYFN